MIKSYTEVSTESKVDKHDEHQAVIFLKCITCSKFIYVMLRTIETEMT